jgi:hypothetical protein
MHVCMYVCMYVCVCVFTYVYKYILYIFICIYKKSEHLERVHHLMAAPNLENGTEECFMLFKGVLLHESLSRSIVVCDRQCR